MREFPIPPRPRRARSATLHAPSSAPGQRRAGRWSRTGRRRRARSRIAARLDGSAMTQECRRCLRVHMAGEYESACLDEEFRLLVRELKRALWDETETRLHARTVPSEVVEVFGSVYDERVGKWKPDWTCMEPLLDAGAGPPYTTGFAIRISHPDEWGSRQLAMLSIEEIADMCRSRHHSALHRSPGRTSALCERVVSGLTEYGYSLSTVTARERRQAEEHGYEGADLIEPQYIKSCAVHAMRHGASWRHRRLHQYMRSARENERDSVVVCPLCQGQKITMRRRAA
jgi:hypothetical protein